MGFINYVCKKNNIKLLPLRAVGLKDKIKGGGFAVTPEAAKNLVLYDDTVNQVEKNHIVLHEIGHILLGHLDNDLDTDTKEMEANIFAAVVLAITLYKEYEAEKL